MAKKLRDIAGKGQFAGVNKTTVAPPDIDDKNLYQWNAKDGVAFVKKHDTETHDYPYDAEAAFKGKKGGGEKTSKYKFQKDGVYEAACNQTNEGVMCEVHGEAACPSGSDQEPRYKGKKMLTDKKHSVKEASQYRSTFGMGAKRGWASSKAGKVTFQDPHPLPKGGTPKAQARAEAEKLSKGVKVTKLPPGKAKLKEEDIQEVAPPSKKIESWIKSNKERFIKQYGKEKGTQVLYAKAWKMHGQSESGPATNTDYAGPGAAGWSTGRLDVGTL
jgi:hypothetical protein